MKPHRCPCCDGAGTVSRPLYVTGDQCWYDGSLGAAYSCHPCAGTGVVWEPSSPPIPWCSSCIGTGKGDGTAPRCVGCGGTGHSNQTAGLS